MSAPLLRLEGMPDGSLTVERVLEYTVVDEDGRLLVSMVDVLAIMRLDADAEILLVHFGEGANSAWRVAEMVESDDVFLQLLIPGRFSADAAWNARLWSSDEGLSATIVSISAMTFASFVGRR